MNNRGRNAGNTKVNDPFALIVIPDADSDMVQVSAIVLSEEDTAETVCEYLRTLCGMGKPDGEPMLTRAVRTYAYNTKNGAFVTNSAPNASANASFSAANAANTTNAINTANAVNTAANNAAGEPIIRKDDKDTPGSRLEAETEPRSNLIVFPIKFTPRPLSERPRRESSSRCRALRFPVRSHTQEQKNQT